MPNNNNNNNKLLYSQKSKLKWKHIGFEMLLTNAKNKTTFRWFIVFGQLNKKVEIGYKQRKIMIV